MTATTKKADGEVIQFDTLCRVDTRIEAEYRNGGTLQTVIRTKLNESRQHAGV